jgi:hypothetical protein
VADGVTLSELASKQLQHVFTVWFPRALYQDLTPDTAAVDVVVRIGRTSGKNVYNVSFLGGNGSLIKKVDYDEDRLTGKTCNYYDQSQSGYYGRKDGVDYRIVIYMSGPITTIRRPPPA